MEEKYTVTPNQESIIRKAFKHWDKDGDGVISFEEFTAFFEQVLLKENTYKVKSTFQEFDENEDQNLDFTEFKNFFLKIAEGELLNAKPFRLFKKFLKKSAKTKQQLENPVLHKSSVTVNVGNTEAPKTKFDFKILVNNVDEEKHLQHISRGLHIEEGQGMIILRIQSKTGSDIMEKLKQLIDDVKAELKSYEFGKVIDSFIDSFKFQYYYDEEMVAVGVTSNHAFLDFLKFAAEYFIEGYLKGLSLFVQTELLHKQDLSEMLKQTDESSIRQAVSKDFKVIYRIFSTAPAIFTELMKKFDPEKLGSSDCRALVNGMVLYSIWTQLIQDEADVTYNYKSLSTLELLDFLTTYKPKKIFDMNENKKQEISKKINDFSEGKVAKYSFAKQVTELFKSGLIANFSVSAVIPHVIVTGHVKTSGFKSLLEFVQNLSKPKEKQGEGESGSGSESD